MSLSARMRYLISVDGFLRLGTYYLMDVSAIVETLRLAGHDICVRHAETGREWINTPVEEIMREVVAMEKIGQEVRHAG